MSPRRRRVRRRQCEPPTFQLMHELHRGPPWYWFEDEEDARETWDTWEAWLRERHPDIFDWWFDDPVPRDPEPDPRLAWWASVRRQLGQV